VKSFSKRTSPDFLDSESVDSQLILSYYRLCDFAILKKSHCKN